MNTYKTDITAINPISYFEISSFDTVADNTQASVNMQKEIQYASNFYTGHKMITSTGPMTNKIHDKRHTNLCSSIAVTSALRAAQLNFLDNKGKDKRMVRQELDDITGNFSFDKMLVLFTGCVSPRSMDGIVCNSIGTQRLMNQQDKRISTAIYRLAHRTMIDMEGWKKLTPVVDLFQKYQINSNRINLEYREVDHPLNSNGNYTYDDAIKDNHVVVMLVYSNWVSDPTERNEHVAHGVLLFSNDDQYYQLKNSSYQNTPHGSKDAVF